MLRVSEDGLLADQTTGSQPCPGLKNTVMLVCGTGEMLSLVVEGTRGCRDVARLCTAAGVLTQMLNVPEDAALHVRATEAMLRLLTCPFPKARITWCCNAHDLRTGGSILSCGKLVATHRLQYMLMTSWQCSFRQCVLLFEFANQGGRVHCGSSSCDL